MKREICTQCERPQKACLCRFIQQVSNDIDVVVLQHPKEVNHAKGTLPLLSQSLSRCKTIVTECADDSEAFKSLINEHLNSCYVLYPSDNAISLINNNKFGAALPISCLVLLDATWRKAYKMYQVSSLLKKLPHLMLSGEFDSLYSIRKTDKKDALSTLEACCHALAVLENAPKKYDPLLNSFVQFNQFQLSFRPTKENE